MKYIKIIISAVLGGMWISIGGAVYLSVENKVIGSFLFSIGLFMIVTNKLSLFTGKIGYLFDNKPKYIIDLILIWIGNFIGTGIVALTLKLTRSSISSEVICNTKLNDNLLSIFILAVFCGLLMFVAVNGYKEINDPVGKYIAVSVSVMVFIICGFEHCVANMFYFTLGGVLGLKTFGYILVMTLGNAVGAFIMPLGGKIVNYDIKTNKA